MLEVLKKCCLSLKLHAFSPKKKKKNSRIMMKLARFECEKETRKFCGKAYRSESVEYIPNQRNTK